jgi:hypothetical protein
MSTKWGALAAATVTFGVASLPAEAHHSWAAVTDTGRPVQTKMTLSRIDWINPHTWLHFSLTRADGTVMEVSLENEGIAGLRRAGFNSAADFPVGDVYDVTYYPNRDGSPGGFIAKIINVTTGRFYEEQAPGQPAGGRGGVVR